MWPFGESKKPNQGKQGDDPRAVQSTRLAAMDAALEDAEVLADYAARYGVADAYKEDVYKDIEEIAAARDAFSRGELSGAAQTNFYSAFSHLAAGVAPVTVASLKASLDEYGVEVRPFLFFGPKDRISLARRATMRRQRLALLAFLALLAVHSIWFVATSLMGSIGKAPADEANLLIQSCIRTGQIPSPKHSATAAPSPTPKPTVSNVSNVTTPPASTSDDLSSQVAYVLWTFQRRSVVERLYFWNGFVDPAHFIKPPEHEPEMPEDIRHVPVGLVNWEDSIVVQTKYMTDLLQQLVLPPLYGAVGALAYVLRTLSQQAKERVYRTENELVWDLRISLGILAGLAIGWFLKPSTTEVNGIGLASPFALAFLAGYSVDLLFTAMDHIVAAFSGSEKTPEGSVKRSLDRTPQSLSPSSSPAASPASTLPSSPNTNPTQLL
jgi:hypothetical protein